MTTVRHHEHHQSALTLPMSGNCTFFEKGTSSPKVSLMIDPIG